MIGRRLSNVTPPGLIEIIRGGNVVFQNDRFLPVWQQHQANDIIRFGSGEFEIDQTLYMESAVCRHIFGLFSGGVVVIGRGKNTVLNIRSDIDTQRDNQFIQTFSPVFKPAHVTYSTVNNPVTVRNMVMNYVMASGKDGNYADSIYRNCPYLFLRNVVVITSGGSNLSMYYCNNAAPPQFIRTENCAFITHMDFETSFSGASIGNVINSAFSRSFPDGTVTNCVNNQEFDLDYRLTNSNNSLYGVYSGEYAWK